MASFGFALEREERAITYNFALPERHTVKDIADTFAEVGGYLPAKRVIPLRLMLAAAWGFEVLNAVGLKTSINRPKPVAIFQRAEGGSEGT